MRNLIIPIFFYGFLILILSGCDFDRSAGANDQYSPTVEPTVSTNADSKPLVNVRIDKANAVDSEDPADGNEITECSPEKVFQGDILKISFEKNHGQNFAIFNEETRDFYFLTANNLSYFPYMPPGDFKQQLTLELDVSKVRSASGEVDSEGYNKSKPYFTKTGWYRIIIGHQALDVDFEDMPVTGSCRIYFINKKRQN